MAACLTTNIIHGMGIRAGKRAGAGPSYRYVLTKAEGATNLHKGPTSKSFPLARHETCARQNSAVKAGSVLFLDVCCRLVLRIVFSCAGLVGKEAE